MSTTSWAKWKSGKSSATTSRAAFINSTPGRRSRSWTRMLVDTLTPASHTPEQRRSPEGSLVVRAPLMSRKLHGGGHESRVVGHTGRRRTREARIKKTPQGRGNTEDQHAKWGRRENSRMGFQPPDPSAIEPVLVRAPNGATPCCGRTFPLDVRNWPATLRRRGPKPRTLKVRHLRDPVKENSVLVIFSASFFCTQIGVPKGVPKSLML